MRSPSWGVHLASGMGRGGTNDDKRIQMCQLILSVRAPWLVIDDFDVEPHGQEKTAWPNLVDGGIWVAGGSDYACASGAERLIDFMAAPPSMII
eukprot:2766281-Pyramimonas_sp.AAC.1